VPGPELHERLESGEVFSGVFTIAGAEVQESIGLLTWSAQGGARLHIPELDDPWSIKFGDELTIHGTLDNPNQRVTLMPARMVRQSAFGRPTHFGATTLAIGAHTELSATWPSAAYAPPGLHEWLQENGLSKHHADDDPLRPIVEWRQPEPIVIELPGAAITLRIHANSAWSGVASPDWSISTYLEAAIKPDTPLTISEYWRTYGVPLLSFATFAADRSEVIPFDRFYEPSTKTGIVVLHQGRKPQYRDWHPLPGHFLFRAEDVDSVASVLGKWISLSWNTTPSLALFGETINEEAYSPSRFLTLYTAAEGYFRGVTEGSQWKLAELVKRASISVEASKMSKEAISLMGALRRFHAHLNATDLEKQRDSADEAGEVSLEEVSDATFESIRRLQAVMQACLLRDLGFNTSEIERLITQHYQDWPLPSLATPSS
jgi:hypothetical protein